MNPWEMMGAQQQQAPMTVWDYPGVKEAVGLPVPQVPQLPQTEQPQEQPMANPWQDLMGTGYGTYL